MLIKKKKNQTIHPAIRPVPKPRNQDNPKSPYRSLDVYFPSAEKTKKKKKGYIKKMECVGRSKVKVFYFQPCNIRKHS